MRRHAMILGLALCLTGIAPAHALTADDAVRIALRKHIAPNGPVHDAAEPNVAAAMTEFVEDVRGAWFRAVAARQALALLDELRETLDLSAEFAQSLRDAGNLSALDLMRHRALQAETAAGLAVLRADLQIEQERLAHLVGMALGDLGLPDRLADVPPSPAAAPATTSLPPEAQWSVRTAHLKYLAAHERARAYEATIVPLRRKITEETTLRFNGMLVDIFALLADVREQAGASLTAIEAQRDFWLAENALRYAEVVSHEPQAAPVLAPGARSGAAGGGH